MSRWVVTALRVVLAVALLVSVVVQVVVVAAAVLGADGDDTPDGIRAALAVVAVLGVGTLQVVAVCTWRLLTRVRRGTVFSRDSFRYVDGVIGSVATGAVLVFAVAVVARFANHRTAGDEVAPGVVAFICVLALVVAGVALLVYVLRCLLAQAVDLDAEARELQSELDGVI